MPKEYQTTSLKKNDGNMGHFTISSAVRNTGRQSQTCPLHSHHNSSCKLSSCQLRATWSSVSETPFYTFGNKFLKTLISRITEGGLRKAVRDDIYNIFTDSKWDDRLKDSGSMIEAYLEGILWLVIILRDQEVNKLHRQHQPTSTSPSTLQPSELMKYSNDVSQSLNELIDGELSQFISQNIPEFSAPPDSPQIASIYDKLNQFELAEMKVGKRLMQLIAYNRMQSKQPSTHTLSEILLVYRDLFILKREYRSCFTKDEYWNVAIMIIRS